MDRPAFDDARKVFAFLVAVAVFVTGSAGLFVGWLIWG